MNSKQKILIIGSGGREHAIGWKITQSPECGELFFAPGNAGTQSLGTNIDISGTEIDKLIEFVKNKKIDLTLAIPDDPLALGIVNEFRKNDLKIFGPTKEAAQLESSKAFSKLFMKRHNLPTASFEVFNDYKLAQEYLDKQELPIVIKASGLALGKGVIIAQTRQEANEALENILLKKVFGNAGDEVIIEEFLIGNEISVHVISDGISYKIFPISQDHKKIGENDTGSNTGGMGTIAPVPGISDELLKQIDSEIVAPTLNAMKEDGIPYEGILYPGLILTKDGPKILEYNARFGDPETQVYMRLLETDLLEMINACVDKKLTDVDIKWSNLFACNIVLASGGYPGNYEKGKIIEGLERVEDKNILIFQAGTKYSTHSTGSTISLQAGSGQVSNLVTNGGRVLGVSAIGETLEKALNTAYGAVKNISFEGMQYRKDIGGKVFAKNI
jgi:phosphoribosylamine--glycine ligase